ncbi:DUF3237 family protein [Geobacillus jurassicus]|uniref:DUF3237 family protein n=1 Tax=Geobacillus jurassicus TaxID=235932 RepID=A0ABV6GNP1_9BACL|nr:DUF3237 family protein [Geobacillus jurassicus]
MRGKVLPGGADYQLIRKDGVAELLAHYVIETDDGVPMRLCKISGEARSFRRCSSLHLMPLRV